MTDPKIDAMKKVSKGIPPPVTCFADGAICPWCGETHETITFGTNNCKCCDRYFVFGYPEEYDGKEPVSWVPFPYRAFRECGFKPDLLPEFKPNDRLKALYHMKVEEATGVESERNPQ